jgi:hypothetical protein
LRYLEKAKLLNALRQKGKGVSALQKPDKIYLENTNLAYAFRDRPDVGNVRETFAASQFINAGYEVHLPKKGDFLVEERVIEVGGKNKSGEQIDSIENAIIAADDIELGYGNKIPLWLFGFLY